MSEDETVSAGKVSKKAAKKSPKKPAVKSGSRYFAFIRPNYQIGVPREGSVKTIRANGKVPVVEVVDPVLIEVYLESQRKGLGVQEVDAPLSDDVAALCTKENGTVNIDAYNRAYQTAIRGK